MKIRQKRAREILILILKSRSLIDKERALIEKYYLQKVANLLKVQLDLKKVSLQSWSLKTSPIESIKNPLIKKPLNPHLSPQHLLK